MEPAIVGQQVEPVELFLLRVPVARMPSNTAVP
jgi:hypothetical protein